MQQFFWTLFLDRDGVINRCLIGDYVKNWSEFEFLEATLSAIPKLNSSFRRIVVVTNQQGVGKGLMSQSDLDLIHDKMLSEIQNAGGFLDKIYACTDLAIHNSLNRKPNIGMGLQAQQDFPDIDFRYAIMVGDTITDMQFGQGLGMRTVFVGDEAARPVHAQMSVRDLGELVERLPEIMALPAPEIGNFKNS